MRWFAKPVYGLYRIEGSNPSLSGLREWHKLYTFLPMSSRLNRFFIISSVLILFGALFPWVFMFQGRLFGIVISLRALGDIGGILLTLLGLVCFFSKRFHSRLLELARALDTSSPTLQLRVMFGFAVLYFILAVSHKFRSQSLISTHAYDLGFFSNICWNTAHGNWFFSSELERNFKGVHGNWILWPLAFFYKFGGDARILFGGTSGVRRDIHTITMDTGPKHHHIVCRRNVGSVVVCLFALYQSFRFQ